MAQETQQQRDVYQRAVDYISQCSPEKGITTSLGSLFICFTDKDLKLISFSLTEYKPVFLSPLFSSLLPSKYILEVNIGENTILKKEERGKNSVLGVLYETTMQRVETYKKQASQNASQERIVQVISALEEKLNHSADSS